MKALIMKRTDTSNKKTWRDLDSLPNEILSKAELDTLQKEVVDEIEKIQNDTITKTGASHGAKPQTLFYCHKYIDAKFNKNDFDVDSYYIEKQNTIDRMYAEGIGELEAEFTGYTELLASLREVGRRLRRKTNILDPKSALDEHEDGTRDDTAALRSLIEELPKDINWQAIEEK